MTPAERLAVAWHAYRAGVVDASRRWSRLSPGEVIEVRAQLDTLRAEVFAAEDALPAGEPARARAESPRDAELVVRRAGAASCPDRGGAS